MICPSLSPSYNNNGTYKWKKFQKTSSLGFVSKSSSSYGSLSHHFKGRAEDEKIAKKLFSLCSKEGKATRQLRRRARSTFKNILILILLFFNRKKNEWHLKKNSFYGPHRLFYFYFGFFQKMKRKLHFKGILLWNILVKNDN